MDSINLLLITAAGTGFVHALVGPDHYLPFIFIAKARKWSLKKTLFVTFYCGLGHLASSVIISLIGIAIGYSIAQFEKLDIVREGIAGWIFLLFGLSYMIWGILKAVKDNKQTRLDQIHDESKSGRLLTPWILFIIFVFGPCEILIPQVMIPAAQHNVGGVIAVISLFSISTILAMCAAVAVGYYGFKIMPTAKIDRYMHAITGAMLFLTGLAFVIIS